MTQTVTPRVVMISGANRGIGAVLAQHLAASGWLVSAGMRDPSAMTLPAPHLAHAFDATQRGQEQLWVDETLKQFGRIDAVVANAGVVVRGSILECSEEDMDLMLGVNLRSPMRLVKAAWAALAAGGQGRVIVMASLSGKRIKSPESGPYGITKHAAVALVHSIRRTGRSAGIRATAICPGFVATDMARAVTTRADDEMTQPGDVATLIETVLNLPNNAGVAELCISCSDEDLY